MKKLYPIFLLFLFLIAEVHAQYAWQQLANFGGSARYGAYGFSIGSFGYIGGGYAGSNLSDFWQYDPSTNSWSQKAAVPVSVRAASTFVINGNGYLTGGGPNFGPFNSTLYMYDPVANTWTGKTSFPGAPRYGAAAFAIGTKGYFGIGNGGSANGPYYKDFYEYDALADVWTQKATFPGALRYGTYGIAYNGKGYAGFGYDNTITKFYGDWYEYDPVADAWTAKATFPGTPRHYVGGFVINNLIYVGSGNASNGQAVKDFYEYDPVTDSWKQKQDYGAGSRWIVVSFSIGNIGYFGTGADIVSNYKNEFWEYAPVAIPPVASFLSSDSTICPGSCINFTNLSTNSTSWLWSFPGALIPSSTMQNPQNICYLAGGDYNVTLIASNPGGSDTLKLLNYIHVYPTPPTPLITQSNDTLFCFTDPSFRSYQWYYGSTMDTGAVDTFYVEKQFGNINLAITDTNGCQISVGINIDAVHTPDVNSFFNCYPNPVNSRLHISLTKPFNRVVIEVYTALGERLFHKVLDSAKENTPVDFSSFAPGVYLVSVNMDGRREFRKIIKEGQ